LVEDWRFCYYGYFRRVRKRGEQSDDEKDGDDKTRYHDGAERTTRAVAMTGQEAVVRRVVYLVSFRGEI